MDVPSDGLSGLADIAPRGGFGSMANENHQSTYGFMKGTATFELAIVEFDDQGCCYKREQMDGVAARLDALRQAEADVILLVFVHGWKHDARTDDDNLSGFRNLLAAAVKFEQDHARPGKEPRPVLGIFVGWRGLSLYGTNLIEDSTFWDRQSAGLRVSTGSVRELFGRLRHYRNHQLNREKNPLLVIVGHSFGGMIVYSALAQSLIEAASSPGASPRLADLVLLINPAFEGERFLPIFEQISAQWFKNGAISQLPVFVCAQANNDDAVGTWFPVGATPMALLQKTRTKLQRQAITHGIGFVEAFKTHDLDGPNGTDLFVLGPSSQMLQPNPFWVVRATKPVIDGHGGIWQQPFQDFLWAVIFAHARGTNGAHARLAPSPPPAPGGRSMGDLATFAKTVRASTGAPPT